MSPSQVRRAENELVFREHNERVERLAIQVLDPESRADMAIKFVCECSNEDCHDRIELPVNEVLAARINPKRFIVKPGHEQLDIERIVERDGYLVVEKFVQLPSTNGKLNRTK